MKKSLLTVALAMVAMASSAQIYVGGALNFNANSTKTTYQTGGENKDGSTSFDFAPEVGWIMDDIWSFGASLDIHTSKAKGAKKANTSWSISPYARYTLYTANNISCFADGVFSFGSTPLEGNAANATAVSIAVRPGISLSLTENISLVSTVNLLSFSTVSYKYSSYKNSYTGFGLGANVTALSFGLYYTF